MAEEKVKKRPVGRPRLMDAKLEAMIEDCFYTARACRESHYEMKALSALQKDIGIENIGEQEDFDKFKAAFPAVIIGTGYHHHKLRKTLLAELGRWPKEWIPGYARQVEGMPIKEAVALLRANRLKLKRDEE